MFYRKWNNFFLYLFLKIIMICVWLKFLMILGMFYWVCRFIIIYIVIVYMCIVMYDVVVSEEIWINVVV